MSFSIKDPLTGRKTNAKRALISGTPPGGWEYEFSINKMVHKVRERSPSHVLAETKKVFKLNNRPFCDEDFWLHANMQWMSKVPAARHLVSVQAVLKEVEKREGTEEKEGRLEWEERGLQHVAFTLAVERFELQSFFVAMSVYGKCCNPKESPVMGSAGAMVAANKALVDLRNNPPTTRAQAQRWFYQFYNSERRRLGKKPVKYHTFAKLNHW